MSPDFLSVSHAEALTACDLHYPHQDVCTKSSMTSKNSVSLWGKGHMLLTVIKNAESVSSGYLSYTPWDLQLSPDVLRFTKWESGFWKQVQENALAAAISVSSKSPLSLDQETYLLSASIEWWQANVLARKLVKSWILHGFK